MLLKKTLLSSYSITTQILEQNSLWPWKLWVWDRPMESSGVEAGVSREWWGKGGGGGRGFSLKKDQCRLLMPRDLLLLLLWLYMSLYKQCCKAVLDGRICVGQAQQRVFGFLNGPLQFTVGALKKERQKYSQTYLSAMESASFVQNFVVIQYFV